MSPIDPVNEPTLQQNVHLSRGEIVSDGNFFVRSPDPYSQLVTFLYRFAQLERTMTSPRSNCR